jgi:hypothetical protein
VSATWKRKYEEAMRKVKYRDGEIEQHKYELLMQRRQLIEKDAQIQAQSARLAQFISKKSVWISLPARIQILRISLLQELESFPFVFTLLCLFSKLSVMYFGVYLLAQFVKKGIIL